MLTYHAWVFASASGNQFTVIDSSVDGVRYTYIGVWDAIKKTGYFTDNPAPANQITKAQTSPTGASYAGFMRKSFDKKHNLYAFTLDITPGSSWVFRFTADREDFTVTADASSIVELNL